MLLPEAFSCNYLFQGLNDEQIGRITSATQVREYADGDAIVRIGEPADEFYLVLAGQVNVMTGRGEVLMEAGPGFVIGEVSLVDQEPRSATALCVGRVRVAAIPSARLRAFMRQDVVMEGYLMTNLARVIAQRLRGADSQIESANPYRSGAYAE